MTRPPSLALWPILLLCLAGPVALSAQPLPAGSPYPNTSAFDPDYAADAASQSWYRQCLAVRTAVAPAGRRPAARCNAEQAYYDAREQPRQPTAVWRRIRACALARRDNEVLMMLYANGLGVARDLKIARHYACTLPGAPAEMEDRIAHLVKLEQAPDSAGFDLCDDLSSGELEGRCQGFYARAQTRALQRQLAALSLRLSAPQRTLLARLAAAEARFADLHGDEETDRSGSWQVGDTIEASSAIHWQFAADLQALENGRPALPPAAALPALAAGQQQRYDSLAHAATDPHQRLGDSSITPDGVRHTQQAWQAYRDAWLAFARARYPTIDPDALAAGLNRQRLGQLQDLVALTRPSGE